MCIYNVRVYVCKYGFVYLYMFKSLNVIDE
jgi:hypothetical protein